MDFKFLTRYKPLLFCIGLAAVALAFYIGNFVFTEPAADCCATGFDATPYEQAP